MAVIPAAPLTPGITARWGARAAALAWIGFVAGGVPAALFVVARVVQGFGSGVLTTFGISAVARSIPERLRKHVHSPISAGGAAAGLHRAGVRLDGWPRRHRPARDCDR